MKKLVLIVVVLAALLGAAPAQAHLAYKPKGPSLQHRLVSQTLNLRHARYVARHGKGEHRRWASKAVVWLTREQNETRAMLQFYRSVYAIARRQAFALGVTSYEWYSCAVPLISRENANRPSNWSPTRWNGQGSDAYGLGQALPPSKMRPHGRDYMTNPATQIRWMDDYVNRWGGWCGANQVQLNQGWY